MTNLGSERFECPECGEELSAGPDNSTNRVECPNCFTKVLVPSRHPDAPNVTGEPEIIGLSETSPDSEPVITAGGRFLLTGVGLLLTILIPAWWLWLGIACWLDFAAVLRASAPAPASSWAGAVCGCVYFAWGIHTLIIGMQIWDTRVGALLRAQHFIRTCNVYALAVVILKAVATGQFTDATNVIQYVMSGFVSLMVPYAVAYAFLRFSKRLRSLFEQ